MIHNHKILAVIPARGGSKGVPRKNIRTLAGKPLIAWTIEAAKKSKYIDRCIVSSDDNEIMEVAEKWGGDVPFKRPLELGMDDTPDIEVFFHAINQLPMYDYIVKLQPTSPLRRTEDIDKCIEFCFEKRAVACVSVAEADSSPYWMYNLNEDQKMLPLIPMESDMIYQRQKLPKVYQLNGAVYIANKEWLKQTRSFIADGAIGYIMPQERSYDIDTESDFMMVEFNLEKMNSIKA